MFCTGHFDLGISDCFLRRRFGRRDAYRIAVAPLPLSIAPKLSDEPSLPPPDRFTELPKNTT